MPDYFKVSSDRLRTLSHPRRQIAFLPAMPVAERNRLAGLAQGLRGVSTSEPTGYLLTPARAAKCLILFKAGFSHAPSETDHYFAQTDGRRLSLAEAVAQAKNIAATTAIKAA